MKKLNINQKGFVHWMILAVTVVLLAFGGVGYYVWQKNKANKPSILSSETQQKNTISDTNNKSGTLTSAKFIDGLKNSLASKLTIITSKDLKSGQINAKTEFTTGPAAPVSGYKYLVAPEGYSLAISYYQTSVLQGPDTQTIRNVISDELSKYNFKEIQYSDKYFIRGSYFENDNLICSKMVEGDPISVNCVDKTNYPKLAKTVEPIATTFFNTSKSDSDRLTSFGSLEIKRSNTPGYMYASVGIDNALGYFYQKEGKWYLYIITQNGLSCNFTTNKNNELNNDDARKALIGHTCTNDDYTTGTVK